jgi:hypothetical protein
MSHLRPEDHTSTHRKPSCKKGRHRYGDSKNVGGGIARQVCVACGAVSIDLTGATDVLDEQQHTTQATPSLYGLER